MKKAEPPPTMKTAARQNRRNIADKMKKVKRLVEGALCSEERACPLKLLSNEILISHRVKRHLNTFVYARHGRELMGFKSPVNVPV